MASPVTQTHVILLAFLTRGTDVFSLSLIPTNNTTQFHNSSKHALLMLSVSPQSWKLQLDGVDL